MQRIPPPGEAPGPDETLDQLVGDWWIFQLRGGHRFSTDDLLTAWRAAVDRPNVCRSLDLGSGIGSVGLYLLGLVGREDMELVGLEAQEVSHKLAVRTVARNGLAHRVTMLHGDLRDPDAIPNHEKFELITGSPPYMPIGKGVMSPHPQRAHCRMELRGSIFDYSEAARRWAAPGARFVFVMSARDDRTEQGPAAAGWTVLERMDVVFREGETPMIAVLTCALNEDGPHPPRREEQLTIRMKTGRMSPEYRALRQQFGFYVDE